MSSDPAATSFNVTCPRCGERLRFAMTPEAPGRLRVQCSACRTVFAVRRPGVDAASLPPLTAASPTLTGMPVPRPAEADRTSPLTGKASSPPVRRQPARDAEKTFAPGELVAGRYRVIRFIARGGMGEVFEVEDLELRGERVALKTVRSEAARDATAVERFRREIQLARKVTHPNVCRIFDVARHRPEGEEGTAGPVIFLTMELLPGETLAERLRRGPLTPEEALPIVRQVAGALTAAHQAGVVHRDLKPGNVVLVPDGAGVRAVVTDFGLARAQVEEQALTLTAAGVIGTPAYIAPEQIEGKEITPAVDVYALGILLYEALTGQVPFLGDTALSTAVKRLQERAPSPRLHLPELDPRWERVILRCLERDPAARFASARDAVAALDPEAPEAPSPTKKSAPAPARREPAGPPPAAAAARRRELALLLVLLIVASFAVTWHRYRAWKADHQVARAPVVLRRSVAVLGFKDRSSAPQAAWLSAALAEMLSTELGAGRDLRVVAGENVARLKVELALAEADSLAPDTLRRIHTLLGADYVVLGSYTAIEGDGGRQIRLDLRLQDTAAGETTAIAEAGSEAELFDLVTRVGERLRGALGAGQAGAANERRAYLPANPEAARLYAEGLTLLRRSDPAGARDLLVRAVEADPAHALAHSALSSAWAALGYDGKARAEAKLALDLSARLPAEEQLLIEGRYREALQEWPRAVEIYRGLWEIFPDSLDYGLRLAAAQTLGGQALEALTTAAALRALPVPLRDDPRIDLAEATAAGALSDFERQRAAAARAAGKGSAQGARLLAAQARLLECRALRNLGRAEPALAACAEGRRLSEAAGDRSGVAEALTHAANVRYDRGELPEARRLYEEALATYRATGSRAAEAGALNNIAVVLRSQGQLEAARGLYEEVLAITREIGSKSGEAYALNNIAALLLRRGELGAARAMFEQVLAVRRALSDRSGEAYALENIGGALRRQGDLAGALARHEESLAIRRETGQKIGEVASVASLGSVLLDRGELPAAARRFEESLALARAIGNRSAESLARFGLGEVLARQGRLEEAARRHEEALAAREQLGEEGAAAESRLALAALRLEQGDAERAEALAREAGRELAAQGAADGEALALSLAALAANARGDGAAARADMAKAAALVAEGEDLRARLAVGLRAARFQAAAGQRSQAAAALAALLAEAERAGLVEIQLEAGLSLAELETALGRPAEGQARRAAIEQAARAKGYGAIARKAGAVS